MNTADLFWSPKAGDLVIPRHQGSDIYCSPEQAKHPLRIVRRCDLDGVPMAWVEPTGPVIVTQIKGGQPRTSKPNWQSPVLVERLLPYEGEPN